MMISRLCLTATRRGRVGRPPLVAQRRLTPARSASSRAGVAERDPTAASRARAVAISAATAALFSLAPGHGTASCQPPKATDGTAKKAPKPAPKIVTEKKPPPELSAAAATSKGGKNKGDNPAPAAAKKAKSGESASSTAPPPPPSKATPAASSTGGSSHMSPSEAVATPAGVTFDKGCRKIEVIKDGDFTGEWVVGDVSSLIKFGKKARTFQNNRTAGEGEKVPHLDLAKVSMDKVKAIAEDRKNPVFFTPAMKLEFAEIFFQIGTPEALTEAEKKANDKGAAKVTLTSRVRGSEVKSLRCDISGKLGDADCKATGLQDKRGSEFIRATLQKIALDGKVGSKEGGGGRWQKKKQDGYEENDEGWRVKAFYALNIILVHPLDGEKIKANIEKKAAAKSVKEEYADNLLAYFLPLIKSLKEQDCPANVLTECLHEEVFGAGAKRLPLKEEWNKDGKKLWHQRAGGFIEAETEERIKDGKQSPCSYGSRQSKGGKMGEAQMNALVKAVYKRAQANIERALIVEGRLEKQGALDSDDERLKRIDDSKMPQPVIGEVKSHGVNFFVKLVFKTARDSWTDIEKIVTEWGETCKEQEGVACEVCHGCNNGPKEKNWTNVHFCDNPDHLSRRSSKSNTMDDTIFSLALNVAKKDPNNTWVKKMLDDYRDMYGAMIVFPDADASPVMNSVVLA